MNFTFGRLSYFVIKDPNGNMTADLDRGIVAIRYNLLNLPDTVQFENGNRIVYFYYAGGERAGAVTTTYSTPISVPLDSVYLGEDPHFDMWEHRHGNLFYKMGSPSRLLFDDGFFELAERHGGLISQIPYVFVRDHLGSVRLVCNGNTGEVVQSLEYLPSGVIFRSRNFDRQPYRFTGKELLSAHGLDWYDSGARMQEFHIPRFTTMDPLCEKYYSISPYAYCNNNPVKYVDPDGRDWYIDDTNAILYDPELSEKTKHKLLQEGQRYLGATYQSKDRQGNVTTNYRKDGSIIFTNEKDAYNRIVNNSEQTGNEEMGIIMNNGILVLPSYKNSPTEIDMKDYGYSIKDGIVTNSMGETFNSIATIHTHPNGSGPSTYDFDNFGDLGLAQNTPYKPVYVLQLKDKYEVSFIIAAPNASKSGAYMKFFLTQEYSYANIHNLKNGRFSLIQYTNSNNFRKAFK